MTHYIKRRFATLAGIFLLVHVAGAWAQTAGIEYASPDQSVWTTRLDARGEPDNPLLSLAAVLFERAGLAWHGKSYPATRMFKYLQDGTAQFSMLVKAPSLQDCCLWSRKPVATAEIRAYRLGDKAPVKVREQFAGKSVAAIRGYSYAGLRDFIADEKNHVVYREAPNHAAAFKMLASGRVDYAIDYAGPAAEVLAAEPIAGIQFDVLARQDVYLVLSKTYPNAANTMARFESILESLDIERILKMHAAHGK